MHSLRGALAVAMIGNGVTIPVVSAMLGHASSDTVNLNVDLDIIAACSPKPCSTVLRARLPGYTTVTPDVLQRRFLETRGLAANQLRGNPR